MERFHKNAYRLLLWLTERAKNEEIVTFSEAGNAIGVRPIAVAPYLGCISEGLRTIKHVDHGPVPMIQLIVVNRNGVPGWRAAPYIGLTREQFENHSREELCEIFRPKQLDVFNYQSWDRVLDDFETLPLSHPFKDNEGGSA